MAENALSEETPLWRIAICKALVHQRRIIGRALGFPLVENANFDILIELYLARTEKRPVFLWSLCAAANAPYSTAHRKIRELAAAGLILRYGDTRDRRRVEVELTDAGLELLDDMVGQMVKVRWPS